MTDVASTLAVTTVRFALPAGMPLDKARALFETTVDAYRRIPGLIRKYYLYGEGPIGGGVYLWKDRAAAERFFTTEWRQALLAAFGNEPQVVYFDAPVTLDGVNANR